MLNNMKKILLLLALGSAVCSPAIYAAGGAIRWVKVYNEKVNKTVAMSLSVAGFDSEKYSCGDACQMVKLVAENDYDRGDLIIHLNNTACGSSASLNIPFEMEDEDLNTPVKTYEATLTGGFCQNQTLKVAVSGDSEFAHPYRIDITN